MKHNLMKNMYTKQIIFEKLFLKKLEPTQQEKYKNVLKEIKKTNINYN